MPQDFPGWLPDDGAILPSLPCIVAHFLQPAAAIEAQVVAALNSSAATIAMHMRTDDSNMVSRLSGSDDWSAWLASKMSHHEKHPASHGRRLGLAYRAKEGCDRGDEELVLACASRVAASVHAAPKATLAPDKWRKGVHGATISARQPAVAFFEASDSSAVDARFKALLPALVQSEGVPVHTGRDIEASSKRFAGKVYVDFFILARASALVTNCPAESTFIAHIKLLRDAAGLPTYRATDCGAALLPYPAHVHVNWKAEVPLTTRIVDELGPWNAILLPSLLMAAVGVAYCYVQRRVVGSKAGYDAVIDER